MVVDLSHWDPATSYPDVKANGIVGVIYKATQGQSYTDPTYKGQRNAALAAGLQWGAYHFGDDSDPAGQVDNFIKFAEPDKDTLICLDWEDYNNVTMSIEQAKAFISILEDKLGRPNECVLYSGNKAKEALGPTADPWWGNHRLWLAYYGPNPTTQTSWSSAWLWQYTDGAVGPEPHSIPGIGACDISSFTGTPDQLKSEWASGKAQPISTVRTITITITIPDGANIVITQGKT
jgi:lysozyme